MNSEAEDRCWLLSASSLYSTLSLAFPLLHTKPSCPCETGHQPLKQELMSLKNAYTINYLRETWQVEGARRLRATQVGSRTLLTAGGKTSALGSAKTTSAAHELTANATAAFSKRSCRLRGSNILTGFLIRGVPHARACLQGHVSVQAPPPKGSLRFSRHQEPVPQQAVACWYC